MRFIFVLLAAAAASVVSAHNVQLAAHSRECFHEDLHKDDQMSVSFQVGDREFGHSGNLDIDFWVSWYLKEGLAQLKFKLKLSVFELRTLRPLYHLVLFQRLKALTNHS